VTSERKRTGPEGNPWLGVNCASLPLSAGEALRRSTFTKHRKTALTPISDITYPPGTVFQTPEGLRAEDEDTRAAFDVQGGIYPIRESVFRASYEAATPTEKLRVALREMTVGFHIFNGRCTTDLSSCESEMCVMGRDALRASTRKR